MFWAKFTKKTGTWNITAFIDNKSRPFLRQNQQKSPFKSIESFGYFKFTHHLNVFMTCSVFIHDKKTVFPPKIWISCPKNKMYGDNDCSLKHLSAFQSKLKKRQKKPLQKIERIFIVGIKVQNQAKIVTKCLNLTKERTNISVFGCQGCLPQKPPFGCFESWDWPKFSGGSAPRPPRFFSLLFPDLSPRKS